MPAMSRFWSLMMMILTLSPWLTPSILSTLASRLGLLTRLELLESVWTFSQSKQPQQHKRHLI